MTVSKLGLGCMRLPKLYTDKEDIDYEKAKEIVDYAYSHGITYYDTAYYYHGGMSEEFVGKALKEYPRESINIATKMPGWDLKSEEDLERIFNNQLERLQVEYFDYYLYHAVSSGTLPNFYKYNCYEFLMNKKKEGKIRNIGFSFHDTPDVLKTLLDQFKWDFAQIQLNYLDWDAQNAKKQYELLCEYNVPCIVMEPVRGGLLADLGPEANEIFKKARPDSSVASWALRYAASLPNVLTVLSGMSNIEQIIDNINTFNKFEPLSNEEHEVIKSAVYAFKKKKLIPCTACRYCMDCPSGVDIPLMFQLYNEYIMNMNRDSFIEQYMKIENDKHAKNCTECNNCVQYCPQGINIPHVMSEIKKLTD